MPTRAVTNIGTDVATRGAPHARLMPTLGAPNVGTVVATQESCQVLTRGGSNVGHGGGD